MHILFITSGLFEIVGGIARQNSHICKCLCELVGASVDVLSFWDSGQVIDHRYLPQGTRQITFRGFSGDKKRFAWSVTSALLRQNYDVCMVGLVNFIPLLLIPFLVKRQKYIVIVHGTEAWKKFSLLQMFLLNRTQRILSVSHFTANQMTAPNRIAPKKVALLPNALDPYMAEGVNPVQVQDRQEGFARSSKNILTVARLSRLDRYKGHDKIIQALPDVMTVVPDLCYHIVGDGDWQPDLHRLVEACGVVNHVIFHGWVNEAHLQRCYRECDLFVMPSTGEGFGLVYLEAMFHGKAVLASNKDAGQEVVQHGITGLTVDPDDHQSVASSLIELLTKDDLRMTMGLNGKALVENNYMFAHFQQRLMSILQESLK